MGDTISYGPDGFKSENIFEALREYPIHSLAMLCTSITLVSIIAICYWHKPSISQTIKGTVVGPEAKVEQKRNGFFDKSSKQRIEDTDLRRRANVSQRT